MKDYGLMLHYDGANFSSHRGVYNGGEKFFTLNLDVTHLTEAYFSALSAQFDDFTLMLIYLFLWSSAQVDLKCDFGTNAFFKALVERGRKQTVHRSTYLDWQPLFAEFQVKQDLPFKLDDLLCQKECNDKVVVKATQKAELSEKQMVPLKAVFTKYALPETPAVYFIYNQTQQRFYIGQAKTLKQRFYQHFTKTGKCLNDNFAADYRNGDKFMYAYVSCQEEALDALEYIYINAYDTFRHGYNLTPGNLAGAIDFFTTHPDYKRTLKLAKFGNLKTKRSLKLYN